MLQGWKAQNPESPLFPQQLLIPHSTVLSGHFPWGPGPLQPQRDSLTILPGHWLRVASSLRPEPRAWHPGIKNPILALPADHPGQPCNMPEGTFLVAGAVWKAQPGQGVRSPVLPTQVL